MAPLQSFKPSEPMDTDDKTSPKQVIVDAPEESNNQSTDQSTNESTGDSSNQSTTQSVDKEGVNSNLALRIVSPGLPQLNDEMKNTVRLSQQIQLQQKSLIAARNHNSDDLDEDDNDEPKDRELPLEEQPNPSIVINSRPEDSLRLSTPVSARGLKRDHVPTPLNIESDTVAPIPKPVIHSAPLYSKFKPTNSKKPQTTPKNSVKFPTYLTPHKSSPYNTQVSGGSNKRVRLVNHQPHTSVSPYFPRSRYYNQQFTPQPSGNIYSRMAPPFYSPQSQVDYYQSFQNYQQYQAQMYQQQIHYQQQQQQQQQQQSLAHLQTSNIYASKPLGSATEPGKQNQSKVVDVYHGDLLKYAPLKSQPLSSQREVFDYTIRARESLEDDDDRLPVSEDELKEMEEKYSKNNEIFNLHNQEIFGSINLMNQKVFNFRIYGEDNAAESQPEPKDKSDPKDISTEDSELKPPQDKPDTDPENKDSPASDSNSFPTSLAKKKEKFLTICEKTWDEFVSARS